MNINDKYSTIKEWAHAYRKIGWNVIPLYNNSKAPTIKWKELVTRQSTDEEFNNWFDNPVTGLGVITGKVSGIVVIDEDSYKENGLKFEIQTPVVSLTARGGRHHFFKYEDQKTTGFRKGVNVEIKSDGGFLVLPPSVVEIDGVKKAYRWEKAECSMKNLPTISKQELSKFSKPEFSKHVDVKDLLNARVGEQHNSFRTLCTSLFNKYPESEWDQAEALARTAAGTYEDYPESRIDKMIEDAKRFVSENPKEYIAKPQKVIGGPRSLAEVAKHRLEEREIEKDAPSTGYPELDVLVKGFLPGHLYTLTGDTNTGKTALACNFAERISQQGKKVLYFALEPENTIVEYLASIRLDKPFIKLTDEDIQEDAGNIHVYGKAEVSTLSEMLKVIRESETKYDLIIVDHLGYFTRELKNLSNEQSNTLKEIVGLAKEQKTAIMAIATLKKPDTRSREWIPTMNDISGTGAFKYDSTDVFILVRPNELDGSAGRFGSLFVPKSKSGTSGVVSLQFGVSHANITTLLSKKKTFMSLSKPSNKNMKYFVGSTEIKVPTNQGYSPEVWETLKEQAGFEERLVN